MKSLQENGIHYLVLELIYYARPYIDPTVRVKLGRLTDVEEEEMMKVKKEKEQEG